MAGTRLCSAPMLALRPALGPGFFTELKLGAPTLSSCLDDLVARRLSGIVLGELLCDLALDLIVHVVHPNTP